MPLVHLHPPISSIFFHHMMFKMMDTKNLQMSLGYQNCLVVSTPLKNMKVSWDYYSQKILYIYGKS